jgi:hypothetical protein
VIRAGGGKVLGDEGNLEGTGDPDHDDIVHLGAVAGESIDGAVKKL